MKRISRTILVAASALIVTAAATYLILKQPDAELAATAVASPQDSAEASRRHGGLAAHDQDGDGIVYQDAMHPWIVLDEPGPSPDCGMELTPVSVDRSSEAGIIEIDPVTMQNIGVRTAPVRVESIGREIRTTGRVVMDESGERGITLKVSGYIEKLYADYDGIRVRKGQPLLEIYSPDLVSTQEEYLLALLNMERLNGTSSEEDARTLLEAAKRRLSYWDLSEEQIRRIEQRGRPTRTLTFYAPSSGEVMRKRVSEGDYVEAGQKLMDIVDISKNWLMVDIYEHDLRWVKPGTLARIELPYNPGVVYDGRVDYIYHMLDMDLRAAKARIILPGGHNAPIKPGMYATVRIVGAPTEPAPAVPEEAVIRTGDEEVVVLAIGDGRFRPVPVVAGASGGGMVQIMSGLEGDERVVTSAQFLIDSEAQLRSAINAMTGVPADEPPATVLARGADDGSGTSTPVRSADELSGTSEPALPADGRSGASSPEPLADDRSAPSAPAVPQDGLHAIDITVGASGFDPQELRLAAGEPVRLVFTRTTDQTCANQVMIPSLGVQQTDLPLNRPVAIDIAPGEEGRFTFACGMDMLKGTLVVTQ